MTNYGNWDARGDYAARHSQIVSIAGNNVHRQTTVSYQRNRA